MAARRYAWGKSGQWRGAGPGRKQIGVRLSADQHRLLDYAFAQLSPGNLRGRMLVELQSAMAKMLAALEILDEAGAPADVGAHLDLAISRLREVIRPSDHQVREESEVAEK